MQHRISHSTTNTQESKQGHFEQRPIDSVVEAFLTETQLAQRWQMTVKTLQEWRRRRIGPCFLKIGAGARARVRYPFSALEQWELAQTIATTPEGDR